MANKSVKLKIKTIKQIVQFSASSHEVYELLMDSKKHVAFTYAEAKVSRKVGGAVSAYDGWIEARNLKLIPLII